MTPLITWDDKMSVGIREIDEQHKRWIGMMNSLDEAMLSGKGVDAIGKTLAEMEDYTSYHFAYEEGMMEDINYSEIENHVKIHHSFQQEIAKLKKDYLSGEIILGSEVMNKLKNWLISHIMKEDKKFAR